MTAIDRRSLLFMAASLAASTGVRSAAGSEMEEITAEVTKVQLAPAGYEATEVWAYNGTVPGGTIKARQGDRITRKLVNHLNDPTTIHWHGIRIDNSMDGVSGLTQAPVSRGGSFFYDFETPDAGTFWYHPHRNTLEQVSRGLAGPLIVEEKQAPDVDDDIVLMVNDWRLNADAQVIDDFDNMMDRSHAGRIGNYLTVNGAGEFVRTARRFERLRLRIINASSDRIIRIGGQGLDGYVLALDGMPLEKVERFVALDIAPSQRVDLFVDVVANEGGTALLTTVERDGAYALAVFDVKGAAAVRGRDAPAPLPPNNVPLPEFDDALVADLFMEGGAMGGMMGGMMRGGRMDSMRELMKEGMVWALNGAVGMPEQPLLSAPLGQSVRIVLRNNTAFPHAMHLHGHHFRELMAGGYGPARDTILVSARSEAEIAFVADNPGKWMFHCHMLAHQAAGMSTWIDVTPQA